MPVQAPGSHAGDIANRGPLDPPVNYFSRCLLVRLGLLLGTDQVKQAGAGGWHRRHRRTVTSGTGLRVLPPPPSEQQQQQGVVDVETVTADHDIRRQADSHEAASRLAANFY